MTSTDEVLALLDRPVEAAALAAALEMGLFDLLAAEPADGARVGRVLGIPAGRADAWLSVLAAMGFLEAAGGGWRPTEAADQSIVRAYSPDTWRLLAQEARERVAAIGDLPAALRATPTHGKGRTAGYVEQMAADPERARRFTRMLYEIHRPLAADVAATLDLAGVGRLMDVGGGSGIVACALARRWPDLEVTVVDIANVCAAGREIAAEAGLDARVRFRAADILHDPLPGGFDAALECDVAIYSEALFRGILDALRPGGRFVIVDELETDGEPPDRSQLAWAMVRTLADPDWQAPTVGRVETLLAAAGFGPVRRTQLPPRPGVGGLTRGAVVLEARVAGG
jgi:2-hydroxy-4-(methylsulfanyl)butanoate S-methyltransferase